MFLGVISLQNILCIQIHKQSHVNLGPIVLINAFSPFSMEMYTLSNTNYFISSDSIYNMIIEEKHPNDCAYSYCEYPILEKTKG